MIRKNINDYWNVLVCGNSKPMEPAQPCKCVSRLPFTLEALVPWHIYTFNTLHFDNHTSYPLQKVLFMTHTMYMSTVCRAAVKKKQHKSHLCRLDYSLCRLCKMVFLLCHAQLLDRKRSKSDNGIWARTPYPKYKYIWLDAQISYKYHIWLVTTHLEPPTHHPSAPPALVALESRPWAAPRCAVLVGRLRDGHHLGPQPRRYTAPWRTAGWRYHWDRLLAYLRLTW